jgi:hypothetical protein
MVKEISVFIKRLTVFTIIILALSFILFFIIPHKYITPALPYVLLFFYVITILSYYIIAKASEKKFARFVTAFMLATFIKLMLYLAIMLTYIFFINKKDAVSFIAAFFIYYLFFTIFETSYILLSTKNKDYK